LNKKIRNSIIIASLFLVLTIPIIAETASAKPTDLPEQANQTAKDRVQFVVPENAVEITPGIFSLGKYYVDGTIIEGIMAFHHGKGSHAGGPPVEDDEDPPTSECFSFLADGIKWKKPESWVVNPSNIRDLDKATVVTTLSNSITKWEDQAGKNILGNPTVTTDTLLADATPSGPDGLNEVYFADINRPGVIGVTIVWIQIFPPPTKLMEWDMVYDDDDFDWSLSGESGKMDFENIVTHELGHAVGMGHPQPQDLTTCTDETMYWLADLGETKKRSLNVGDIAGIQQLY